MARSYFTQDDAKPYAVPLSHLRVWDAPGSSLPAAAANDDHGLVHAGINAAEIVKGIDAGATTETQYSRFDFALPAEYVSGEGVVVEINASMQVIADTSASLDLEVYRQAAPTADICATAAQSMNSATPTDYDFSITATNLAPGEVLKCRIKTVVVDSGNAAPNINSQIHSVDVLLDVKG
jgi:hypothetical protein